MGCGLSVYLEDAITRPERSDTTLSRDEKAAPVLQQNANVKASAVSKGGLSVLKVDSLSSTTRLSSVRGPRKLTILHFNDVYNIEPAPREPVGGAARLAWKVKSLASEHPLVLFSGDCFSPSLMSTITLGKQMVPVLNSIGVRVACVGNHDLDYGVDNLAKLTQQCQFPWLMANVLDKTTGEPLAGAARTLLLDWQGVRVGVVGLVEQEWLETLALVDASTVDYLDFVEEGRRLARELMGQGAEVLVALTHMRVPNDRRLAAEVSEFDLVLGGHDHFYEVDFIAPHNNLMVKSGTDFRDLTKIDLVIPDRGLRPTATWERFAMTSEMPEDPEVAAVVADFTGLLGQKMDERVCETAVDLDGRFGTVRLAESNLGNFVADIWRANARTDVVLLNSGSLRSDRVHPAGPLTVRDFVEIHPMVDETVVLEVTGAQLLRALENGVSKWPRLEGRFPQVSGIRFMFDPVEPEGRRVVVGSVFVGNEPLDQERTYTLATKEYLATGHDGYDVLLECKVLVDGEAGVVLPNCLRNHWRTLDVLNALGDDSGEVLRLAAHWHDMAHRKHLARHDSHFALHLMHSEACVRDKNSGKYVIAPMLEGRIVNLHPEYKEGG